VGRGRKARGGDRGQGLPGGPRRLRDRHLPSCYSDLFDLFDLFDLGDLGDEAVGRLDTQLETVASWKTAFREGVVASLDGGEVRGVPCWGLVAHLEAARRLIERHRPLAHDDLTGIVGREPGVATSR
jgi:hypothetical protein